MCQNPLRMTLKGKTVMVACRKCKQCTANRVRDWVGRCIAESKTAVATSVITLTYGSSDKVNGAGDSLQAKLLTYSDVQKYLKRLRNSGHPCRYFLCGEKGSKKGRSHWHIIAFWQKREPNHPHRIKWYEDPHWSQWADGGHTFWDDFNEFSATYVCKYILKAEKEGQAKLVMSKLPPLGAFWFQQLAAKYVDQGLLPQHAIYTFPDVILKATGKPREFLMQRYTLDYFCSYFIAEWENRYGEHPLTRLHSNLIMEFMDRQARPLPSPAISQRGYAPIPLVPIWSDGERVKPFYDEVRNAYWYADFDGKIWWWSYNEDGIREWQDVLRTETEAKALRAEFVQRNSSDAYRNASKGA